MPPSDAPVTEPGPSAASLPQCLQEAMRHTLEGRPEEAAVWTRRAMSLAVASGEPTPADDPAAAAPRAREPAASPWRAGDAPRVLGTANVDGRSGGAPAGAGPGEFTSGALRDGSRNLRYKLFVPPGHVGRLLPLLVMVHGCTQNADDFAEATRMNDLACEQGFFVLYPEQSRPASAALCWNWFKPTHQVRGSGEPALIAAVVQAVTQRHGIDARRIYVAGFSAGGAMAGLVAGAYPEVFAAAGVHSAPATGVAPAVPTIVFHGDADRVVAPPAPDAVLAPRPGGESGPAPAAGPGTRRGTRTCWPAADGLPPLELWRVHGAGHAWCGGPAEGLYADPAGPDASREMLRFFAEHPLPAA